MQQRGHQRPSLQARTIRLGHTSKDMVSHFKKKTTEGILEGHEGIAGLRLEAGRPGAGVLRRDGKTLATLEDGMELLSLLPHLAFLTRPEAV